LEYETSRLKQMYADLSLKNQGAQGCSRKTVLMSIERREIITPPYKRYTPHQHGSVVLFRHAPLWQ
jgi:hypothetical protein